MKTILRVGAFCLFGLGAAQAQTGVNCNDALPFCTGTTYDFPNSTGVPSLGSINCLSTTPNPIWYFMQVGSSGSININIAQENNSGSGLDVDFALWGPFSSTAAACGSISSSPSSSLVDCSYSTAAVEQANIPNAVAGQFYVLLITNFSNQPGNITFEQPSGSAGGTGTTNCGILAGGSSNGPICEGQTLMLTANSILNGSYNWTGPGGFSSTQQNPSIPNATLANSGTYTLIVTSSSGADTAQISAVVNPKPIAALTATALVCKGQAVQFNANGSQPVPGINTYQWIFNNSGVINQTTTTPTTSFTYPTHGTYNTAVIVTASGCKDTANFTVTVAPLPVAAFSLQPQACEEEAVTLDASASTVPSPGIISEYRWDYNSDATNDQVVTGPIVQHAFADGNHAVKLTVATNAGCTASTVKSIQVFEFPEVDFSYTEVCLGRTTNFTNLTPVTTPATVYQWDLGYGTQSSQTNPAIVYPALGDYAVTLVGIVGNLCTDTITKTVTIDNDVTAAFSFNEPCGFEGVFADESEIPAGAVGTIDSWTWSFGDGGYAADQNPTHTYTENGIYNVTLIVGSAEGCADTLTQPVPKYAIPVAAFSVADACLNTPSLITDSSTVSDGIIQTWEWSFGDADSSVAALPIHTYDTTGLFGLRLVVITENGCSDTAYDTAQVYPNPVADFSTDPSGSTTLLEPEVNFIDESTGASTWLWTVGGTGTTSAQNPVWTFEATGTYTISLLVTNAYGCTDEAKKEFVVTPAYNFFAPNAFTPTNGDQMNTHWRVYTMGMKEITLSIYNRWGQLMYSTTDPDFRWDGKFEGKQLPCDVYVYKADTRDIEGKQYQYFGTITIVQ